MRRFWGMVVLTVLMASVAGCGTVTPIKYILDDPGSFMNTRVTVFGVVSNSEAIAPSPGSLVKFHGKYQLADRDKRPITVMTVHEPPANGKELRLTGTVTMNGDDPANKLVLEQTGFVFPGIGGNIPLIAALVVLVALALVLVYLLFRPASVVCVNCNARNSAGTAICKQCGGKVDAVTPKGKICPECRAESPVNAVFCESCGEKFVPSDDGITTVFGPTADLHVVDGSTTMDGKQFPLSPKKKDRKYKIGSLQGMDIRIVGDSTVSREHAAILYEDGTYCVQDIGSTNGTMVNGQKVYRQALSDDDIIQVGKTKLKFRLR